MMNNSTYDRIASLLFASIVLGTAAGVEAENRPNILFLCSDDHAVKAISAYGGPLANVAPTPNIDYAPTFLEIAGLDAPAEIQGRSLIPLLKGETKGWRESLYYAYYELGEHAVPQHFGVRTQTHKLIYFPRSDEWNLFDLVRDPAEMKSVHDDPACRSVHESLAAEFTRLRKKYDAPPFPGNP